MQVIACAAEQPGYVLRNALLGNFIVENILGSIYMSQDFYYIYYYIYYTPSLYGVAYGSQATSLHSMLLYNTELNQAQEEVMQSRDTVNMRYVRLLPS